MPRPRRFLPPSLDAVFKYIFAHPDNEALLISLLTAVLRPSAPITSVKVLDPALSKERVDDKASVLDILVLLGDGRRIDVEMQCDLRGAEPKRFVYMLARLLSEGMVRGDDYSELEPVVGVVFLNATVRPRFHSIYRFAEAHDGTVLTDVLGLHIIELPRLDAAAGAEEPELALWTRFLSVRTAKELQSLAKEDPLMAQAKAAHDRFTRDEAAYRLAESRHIAQVNLAMQLRSARTEGLEEGHKEGLEEGRRQGEQLAAAALRRAILSLCDRLGLVLEAGQRARLEAAGVEQLEGVLAALGATRALPAGL